MFVNLLNKITSTLQLNINILKQTLKQTLPGEKAQLQMAPTNRPNIKIESLKETDYKKSAVIVLLCKDEDDSTFIPLIERETYNGLHSGQIGLPGGKFDANDESLEQTAKRECYEEIGLQNYELLSKLTPLYIPVSGFLVQPYLAYYELKNPNFVRQQREVKTILKLKVKQLLDDSFIKHGNLSPTVDLKHSYFDIDNYKIWGATAMILNEVKAVLKEGNHFE
jgi:8-oxo-dGTP pyrophosphatase MutT (NUDIX family)